MKASASIFLGLFGVAAAANLIAEYLHYQNGIYFSKPLLMIFLGLYLWASTHGKSRISRWVLFGLAWSMAGDTLLMFNAPGRDYFFLLGLLCFLCAHLCYIFAFWGYQKNKPGAFAKQPLLILPFLVFLAGFLFYLWTGIPTALKVPVAVYSTVIIAMSMSCFQLMPKIDSKVFLWLFSGVLLFVLSDSMIALSKFQTANWPSPHMHLFIMITYIAAQYLIASRTVELAPGESA